MAALFHPCRTVAIRAAPPAAMSPELEARVAANWLRAQASSPGLFNGSILSPIGLEIAGDAVAVDVRHSSYAHYTWSRQADADEHAARPGALFVSVVVPVDARTLVVGRMSPSTSTPGLVQLPGGCIPPASQATQAALDELREELGLDLAPSDLRTVGIINRKSPFDVGIVMCSRTLSWSSVRLAFGALLERERSASLESEFSELGLAVAYSGRCRIGIEGQAVDYLPAVMDAMSQGLLD
ncbi:MAG: NUDIX hydrolase [Hyphomicrobiaceae bacterium]|nr:NUDIX hydrolase [Hyphomicrobiaceae bacterium]